MRALLLLVCLMLLAACDKSSTSSSSGASKSGTSSAARHIADGTAQAWHGILLDIPKGWRTQMQQDTLLMMPADANASGTLEELYALTSDPLLKAIDGADIDAKVEQAVAQLQPGMLRQGPPVKEVFGDIDGRVYRFTGMTQNRQKAEVRVYGFLGNDGACSLLVLGVADKITGRESDLKAILGSMTKGGAPSGGEAGGSHPELVGTWSYVSNVYAQNGGRATNSYIMLNGDGTYKWHWEVVDNNPYGAAWNSENNIGTWTATGNTLTLKAQDGRVSTVSLEKKNHPKNTQDPMIILDGRAYVTATSRAPW